MRLEAGSEMDSLIKSDLLLKTILMRNIILLLLAIATISCNNSSNTGISKEVEKLAGGFKFTEGPAVDSKGNVYFTDIPNNMILIWTIDNRLDTFSQRSGGANGLYFDKEKNLLACEGENGQITSTSPAGDKTLLATEYNGQRFNKTNDLWPDAKGGIYFTDPRYGGDGELPQDGEHVYYLKPDHITVVRVCDDLVKPNGLIGTPDGKTLYVTDAQGEKTYRYDVLGDGMLENKTLFVEVGCDGMTIDKSGNVYMTTGGKKAVDVFSPSGKLLESIAVPEKPSNVCFGGKNRKQLFITARTSLYRIELAAKGVD